MAKCRYWLASVSLLLAFLVPVAPRAEDSTASPTTRPLWRKRSTSPGNNLDLGQTIAVSHDGQKVFVTGLSEGLGPSYYTTQSYKASTGRTLWTQSYNGSECTDAAVAVAVSPDNQTLFVTGSSGCLGLEDYATVAYNAATGMELWVSRYDGATHDPDEAFALALSPDKCDWNHCPYSGTSLFNGRIRTWTRLRHCCDAHRRRRNGTALARAHGRRAE